MEERALPAPPVISRPKTLPLHDKHFSWESFERFIQHLIGHQSGVRNVKRYGKSGSNQKGIDLIATLENSDHWVYQCKQCSQYKLADARMAVSKATYPAKKYFLVIACQTDSTVHDFVDTQANWELWDVERVSDEVLKLPPDAARDLVSRFFGPDWCKAFLGVPSPNPPIERTSARPYSAVARPPGEKSLLTREGLYKEDFLDGSVVCPAAWTEVLEVAKKTRIVAVQAPPGSGKSTLAAWIYWKLSQETRVEYLPGRRFQNLDDTALVKGLNGLPDETVVVLDDAHLVQRHLDELMNSSEALKMRFLFLSRPGGFADVLGIPPPIDVSLVANSIAKELARQNTSNPEEASSLLVESQGDLVLTKWLLGALQENPSPLKPTLETTVFTKFKQFWDIDGKGEVLRLLMVLAGYRWLELPCAIETLIGTFGFGIETIDLITERMREATLDLSANSLSLDRHPTLAGLFAKMVTNFRYYRVSVLKPTCGSMGISCDGLTNFPFHLVLLGAAVAKGCISATEVVDRLLLSKLHADCVEFSNVAAQIELSVNGRVDRLDAQTIEQRLTIAFSIYDAMRRTKAEAEAWVALTHLREKLGVTGTPEIDFERKGYLLYQIGSHDVLTNNLDGALKQLGNAAEADDRWATKTARSSARFTGAACMSRILAIRATADVELATAQAGADPRPDLNRVGDLASKLEVEKSKLEKEISKTPRGTDWLWLCHWHRNVLVHLAELRGFLNDAKAVAELTQKAAKVERAINSQHAEEVAAQCNQAKATLEFMNGRFEKVIMLLEHIPRKQLKGGERTGRPAQLLAISYRNVGDLQKSLAWCTWLANECPVDKANGPAVAWATAALATKQA